MFLQAEHLYGYHLTGFYHEKTDQTPTTSLLHFGRGMLRLFLELVVCLPSWPRVVLTWVWLLIVNAIVRAKHLGINVHTQRNNNNDWLTDPLYIYTRILEHKIGYCKRAINNMCV